MRNTRWKLALLVFALACAKSPEPGGEDAGSVTSANPLIGPRWRLVELEGEPALAGGGAREPHLVFSQSDTGDRVGGATGCNTMGGTYETDGTSIRFSQLFSTKMACVEEDRMRQETRFLKAIETADRYAITGDTLELSAGAEVVARFVKS
jgi:heat shock protein HslJ